MIYDEHGVAPMRPGTEADGADLHACPSCGQRVALDAGQNCGACRGRERYAISRDLLALLEALDHAA